MAKTVEGQTVCKSIAGTAILSASQPASTRKYWLVEDQYNDDLYQIMEVYEPDALNRDWLADIVEVLKKNKGWAVALGLGECSILIYADRRMVTRD